MASVAEKATAIKRPAGESSANGAPRVVAKFDYVDEAGQLLYQTVRYEPGFDGESKTYRQRRPDGNGGWINSLNGTRKVLYRLPEILQAPLEQPVFVAEGEKCAEAIRSLGLLATTNPMGANKWCAAYSETLRSRHVFVLPDYDEPGRKHAETVAASLRGVAASVTIVNLPDLPHKGDVVDWLEIEGNGRAAFLELAVQAAQREQTRERSGHESRSEAGGGRFAEGATDKPEIHLTDKGNAIRVIQNHGRDLRHCYPWKKWIIWDGKRWREDDTAEAVRRVKQTQADLYRWAAKHIQELGDVGDDEERKQQLAKLTNLLKHCLSWEHAGRISACLDLMRSESGIPILPEQLDLDSLLLNLQNGTLDLRSGTLREHRREDFITELCPTEYNPEAKAPLWLEFLATIFAGNDRLIQYVQRFLGCCLTGDVSEQILSIFWGAGANGKSTLLNTFLAMLGKGYGIKAAAELLMAKRGESHPTEKADLFGKRFVACMETEEGRRLAESLVKDLTGGDRQRARRMREDFWEFAPTHKVVLCTNHKPVIRGTDHAMWRRVRLIPFTVTIPDDKQDKQLTEKLKAERSGILAWCVRGCLDWQRNGLGLPDEVKVATASYRDEQDLLGTFIGEWCMVGSEFRVRAHVLYGSYRAWAEASGEEPVSQRRFGEALTERGFERYTSDGTWYRGLIVRGEATE